MAVNSQVVANAMLGVLSKAPKEVWRAHPSLLERSCGGDAQPAPGRRQ